MIKLLSATDHKKKTHIEFESLLEVTKFTLLVKPPRQMLTLTQPNASSTVLSAPNLLNFLGLDIKDFYLNNDMDEYEYMWLTRWNYPQYLIDESQIEHLFINNKILVKICKGMYGLPQVGRLAYISLIIHL